jgi:hypothetical protein
VPATFTGPPPREPAYPAGQATGSVTAPGDVFDTPVPRHRQDLFPGGYYKISATAPAGSGGTLTLSMLREPAPWPAEALPGQRLDTGLRGSSFTVPAGATVSLAVAVPDLASVLRVGTPTGFGGQPCSLTVTPPGAPWGCPPN